MANTCSSPPGEVGGTRQVLPVSSPCVALQYDQPLSSSTTIPADDFASHTTSCHYFPINSANRFQYRLPHHQSTPPQQPPYQAAYSRTALSKSCTSDHRYTREETSASPLNPRFVAISSTSSACSSYRAESGRRFVTWAYRVLIRNRIWVAVVVVVGWK
jgi:hypothetical protein